MKYKLDTEEQEILDAFEQGQLKSIAHVQEEIKIAQEAARNTFTFSLLAKRK